MKIDDTLNFIYSAQPIEYVAVLSEMFSVTFKKFFFDKCIQLGKYQVSEIGFLGEISRKMSLGRKV